jgi:hypothetical protein
MEPVRTRSYWKEIIIAFLVLLLLASLVWLFLRPRDRVRDVVFGELGRATATNEGFAGGPSETPPVTSGESVSTGDREGTNPPQTNPPGLDLGGQNSSNMASAPLDAQAGQGRGLSQSESGLPQHPAPSQTPVTASTNAVSPPPPARHAPAQSAHRTTAPFEDNWEPVPANKDRTDVLLAEAKAAGLVPVHPTRTVDLLKNEGEHPPVFDASAGSKIVFVLDNSLNMVPYGKSVAARQEVARVLQSMNAGQSFYVLLFHSGGSEAMPSLAPLPASPENVRAMTNWLFSAGHRAGTDPTKAMQRALGLAPAPDTVWLLSGGPLPDKVIDNIRRANASVNAHINTVGLYTHDGEDALRQIAGENRGAYRFLPPPGGSPP